VSSTRLAVAGPLILFALCLCISPIAAAQAPPEVEQAALGFADGLARGDLTAGWRLLSSGSKAQIDAVQWEEAFRLRPSSRLPSGNDLLRALATGLEPPTIDKVMVDRGEALIEVGGTVQITHQLVLVKEGGAWLVDLPASDDINARQAAQLFLDAVAAASPSAAPRPTRTPPEAGRPTLRVMLIPEAKDFSVLDASVTGDRATVTLACDLPVHVVLRATRSGPGWMVDLSRSLVSTNPLSPDPLKEAREADLQTTCQEQLRQLGRALQMYAAASDDTLPDADHWLDRIRPYLGESASLHCPADQTPGISYAMNRNLSGKERSQLGNQPITPLLYESTLHSPNPADTGESWPSPAFHLAGNNVLYLDGSVRAVAQKPSFALTQGQRPAAGERPQPPPRRQVPARPVPRGQ
jgi:prepilin-type processing-associated H-X9-DG protein